MTIYAHAPEYHIQNHSETENQPEPEMPMTPGVETTEVPNGSTGGTATSESAESSTPLCDTFGEDSSPAATDGTSEHSSCPATPPTATNSAKVNLPVGESLFGLVIVTPFLLHFLKRKFS